jgi:hypothetical protein
VIWLLATVGVMLALGLVGAVGWYLLRSEAVAQRAFRAGLNRQLAGDVEGARDSFRTALRRKPDMAEAALSLGFAYLGFRGAELRDGSIRDLVERARRGDTEDLDAADEAFQSCIVLARARPADAPVRAVFAETNREMIAVAWRGQAATALTRAAAAHDVGQAGYTAAWAQVALNALDQADVVLPSSDTAILRDLAATLARGG